MSNCKIKHTTPCKIPNDLWRCPKCNGECSGILDDEFIIEYSEASADCNLLHAEDELRCTCGYVTTGAEFAAHVAKRLGMVKCTTCNGTGLVKKPKSKKRAKGKRQHRR